MAKDLKVPHLADGVDSAQVSEILVSVGDEIQEGDSVIAVDTDKASVEVPATEGGKIKEIKISEGDEVKTGDVIIILEGSGGAKQSGDEKESEEDNQDEEEGRHQHREGDAAEDAEIRRAIDPRALVKVFRDPLQPAEQNDEVEADPRPDREQGYRPEGRARLGQPLDCGEAHHIQEIVEYARPAVVQQQEDNRCRAD